MEREESVNKDATSKQTVRDLEENEKSVSDEPEEETVPSPDGEFDESNEQSQTDPLQESLLPPLFQSNPGA